MAEPMLIQIQRHYEPLGAQIRFSSVAHRRGAYLRQLVLDDEAFAEFRAAPTAHLRRHGLPAEDDAGVEAFVDAVVRFRQRVRKSNLPITNEMSVSEQTQTFQEVNFDHSSFFFRGFGLWRGSHSETSTGSRAGQSQSFEGIPIVLPEQRREVFDAPFHPGQPLVTPELVEEIRERLDASR
jgi:hypothetical protein